MIDYSTILVILVIECTFLYFTFSFLNFSIWRFWCIGWFSICCFWILITSLIILLSWLTWTTLFLCTLWWFLIMLLFLTWSFICRCFWCISFIWRCCFFRLFTWFLVNSCIISCFFISFTCNNTIFKFSFFLFNSVFIIYINRLCLWYIILFSN